MNTKIPFLIRLFHGMVSLGVIAGFGWGSPSLADTLKTKNFTINITRNCPEGSVTCDNVSYRGVNVKTGAELQLTGKTLHSLGADGTTPGRFLGYEFQNKNYRYVVSEDGTLQIFEGQKLLQEEQGTWQN